jgi:hypothetical protein|tara:strand:- start:759 stop:1031 length:273 start_codon:yes stop_codon:yes gene_type:complete
MKKLVLVVVSVLFLSSYVYADSFKVERDKDPGGDNHTIVWYDDAVDKNGEVVEVVGNIDIVSPAELRSKKAELQTAIDRIDAVLVEYDKF